jgi:hypothetical protein
MNLDIFHNGFNVRCKNHFIFFELKIKMIYNQKRKEENL